MIPTIEDILTMLLAGNCSEADAIRWLNMHAATGDDKRVEDRRYFAAMAMQGLLANKNICDGNGAGSHEEAWIPAATVRFADALLAELSK